MRIIGISCIGPNEKYLDECLEDFKRLRIDDGVFVLNNADSQTVQKIKATGWQYYHDNREWGKYQPRIKTDLLEKIRILKPDWVLAKDGDEIFDKGLTREGLEDLAGKGGVGYYFYVVNLWNDEEHYSRTLNFWNIRFYRYAPEFGLQFQRKNVHCGWSPPIAYYYGNYAPYLLKHYGLMLKEDRQRKVERYDIYDPNAIYKDRSYYEELKSNSKGVKFDEEQMSKRIKEEVRSYKMKKEPVQAEGLGTFIYIVREDGSQIDIPKRDLEQTLRLHPSWKVKGEISLTKPEALPIETAMNDKHVFACVLCGKEFGKETELIIHRRSHDEQKVEDVSDGGEIPAKPDEPKPRVNERKQRVRRKSDKRVE